MSAAIAVVGARLKRSVRRTPHRWIAATLLRSAVVLVGLVSSASVLSAQQVHSESLHFVSAPTWLRQFTGGRVLDQRLSAAATQYRQYGPIPRIAIFDIAYPANVDEYHRLGGYAVLLVTAVCQDATELPPVRVYFASNFTAVTLQLITSVLSLVDPSADARVFATFGGYRVDALYLMPVVATTSPGQLLLDFAGERRGFVLAHFDGGVPDMIKNLPVGPAAATAPDASVLAVFVRREYPDFVLSK